MFVYLFFKQIVRFFQVSLKADDHRLMEQLLTLHSQIRSLTGNQFISPPPSPPNCLRPPASAGHDNAPDIASNCADTRTYNRQLSFTSIENNSNNNNNNRPTGSCAAGVDNLIFLSRHLSNTSDAGMDVPLYRSVSAADVYNQQSAADNSADNFLRCPSAECDDEFDDYYNSTVARAHFITNTTVVDEGNNGNLSSCGSVPESNNSISNHTLGHYGNTASDCTSNASVRTKFDPSKHSAANKFHKSSSSISSRTQPTSSHAPPALRSPTHPRLRAPPPPPCPTHLRNEVVTSLLHQQRLQRGPDGQVEDGSTLVTVL